MAPRKALVRPWTADFHEFFDIPPADWSPPSVLRSWLNARRDRLTVEAVFTRPDGEKVRATGRMRKQADGEWIQVEERLHYRFEGRL